MSQEVLITDGPLACIWKTLHGKDWMEVSELLKLATVGNYGQSAIRAKLYDAKGQLWDRKEEPHPTKKRKQVFYRLRPNVPLPVEENKRTTAKDREKLRATSSADQWKQSQPNIPAWLL